MEETPFPHDRNCSDVLGIGKCDCEVSVYERAVRNAAADRLIPYLGEDFRMAERIIRND